MSLAALISRPCTITLRSSRVGAILPFPQPTYDDDGNEEPATATVETVCEVQQKQRTEPGDQGEWSDSAWDGFFPYGTVFDTGDSVAVDGLGVFEVVGAPWSADTGSSAVWHVEASLRKTAGADETG